MVRAFESVCQFFRWASWSWPHAIVYRYLYGVIIEALNDKKPCPPLDYRKSSIDQLLYIWQIITFIHQEWHFTSFRNASIWHRSSIRNINWLNILQFINRYTFENLLKHKMVMHSLILKVWYHFVDVPFRDKFRFLALGLLIMYVLTLRSLDTETKIVIVAFLRYSLSVVYLLHESLLFIACVLLAHLLWLRILAMLHGLVHSIELHLVVIVVIVASSSVSVAVMHIEVLVRTLSHYLLR
jgi:hypothetical protein